MKTPTVDTMTTAAAKLEQAAGQLRRAARIRRYIDDSDDSFLCPNGALNIARVTAQSVVDLLDGEPVAA